MRTVTGSLLSLLNIVEMEGREWRNIQEAGISGFLIMDIYHWSYIAPTEIHL